MQVSWVRHRDIHLLTVGRYTYTSDQRFEAMHSPHTEEWTLRIRYAQKKDSGVYEVYKYQSYLISSSNRPNCLIIHFRSPFFLSIASDLQCQISTTPPVGKFVYLSIVGESYHFLFSIKKILNNQNDPLLIHKKNSEKTPSSIAEPRLNQYKNIIITVIIYIEYFFFSKYEYIRFD